MLIDVHHHAIPQPYVAALADLGVSESIPGVGLPDWTPQSSIDYLDGARVTAAVLSITAPGLAGATGYQATHIARIVNEFFAGTIAQHPNRFGAFALLPLSDPSHALAEARYALDELGLDGIGLYSSVDGRYLGAPAFEPVLEFIADRGVPAFVHPVPPMSAPDFGVPLSVLEFPWETTRVAASLLYSGVLDRHPNLQLILPHAGGVLPYLIHRMTLGPSVDPQLADRPPADVRGSVRRLWFDLAMSAEDAQLEALTRLVDPARLLFGSDFPLQNIDYATANARATHRHPGLDAQLATNAVGLFDRLAQRVTAAV